MKKALSFVLIAFFAFIVVQCVTLDSQFQSIDSATVIWGEWKNSRGQTVDFPLNTKDGIYLKLAQKQKNDTNLWNDFIEGQNLTMDDVWLRRFALIERIYGKNYPLVEETGVQTGIKLSKDSENNIFSTLISLIPQSLILDGENEVKISNDRNYILYKRQVFHR